MHDDTDDGLGAERPPQPVGRRRRQVAGAGEPGLGDLAGGQADEQHQRATNTVLSSSTRPCGSLNSEPPSRRYSWTSPLTTVIDDRRPGDATEPAHGVDEVLLAGPGEHDAGEQHDAADPHRHRQGVGDAGDDAEDGQVAAGPRQAEGDDGQRRDGDRRELRRRVDDPLRAQHHPGAGDDEHQPGERGPPRPPGVEQVEPAGRVEPAAERLVVYRRAEGDDVEQRAGERQQPHRAQEADGEDVLGAFRPRGDDQHERAEQHGEAEGRQHAAEPRRPVGHLRGVATIVVVVRRCSPPAAGVVVGVVAPGTVVAAGSTAVDDQHGEAEAVGRARLRPSAG